jgi:hypothetical protein
VEQVIHLKISKAESWFACVFDVWLSTNYSGNGGQSQMVRQLFEVGVLQSGFGINLQ